MAVAPPPRSPHYRPADFRPADDYAPLLPMRAEKRWGFLLGASILADPLAPLHEARPWLSTPWQDRSYIAYDFWNAIQQAEREYPKHPVQHRLFDPTLLYEYTRGE